jgi:hypothetical protein
MFWRGVLLAPQGAAQLGMLFVGLASSILALSLQLFKTLHAMKNGQHVSWAVAVQHAVQTVAGSTPV